MMMNSFCQKLMILVMLVTGTSGLHAWRFFWEGIKNPKQVGTVFTCSRATGYELMRYACTHKGPKKILEIGAGTGSITEVICLLANGDDMIDVVEINSKMCDRLRDKFGFKRNVRIYCKDIAAFDVGEQYDFIICTIPFNNIDVNVVRAIQEKMVSITKKGGYCSYVEYMFLPNIRQKISNLFDLETRFDERREVIEAFKKKYLVESAKVLRNVPPIRVNHLRFT
jgi:phosphatidylserine decarboxylase